MEHGVLRDRTWESIPGCNHREGGSQREGEVFGLYILYTYALLGRVVASGNGGGVEQMLSFSEGMGSGRSSM